jgi:MFS transporter, UMF1 family
VVASCITEAKDEGRLENGKTTKAVVSWALYDWANSAYATTVMAGFFPIFFKQYWSAGTDVSVSTFHLGSVNSAAAIVVAALAPILGFAADKGGAKKKFLLFFLILGIAATGGLGLIAKGEWPMAVACYALATIGFAGGNIFYDSLLVSVTKGERMDFVSALGYGAGYLGGGILFAVNVWMTLSPEAFGLQDAAQAAKVSFITVAAWWALFSIPLFLFVKEPTRRSTGGPHAVTGAFREVRSAFRQVRTVRMAFLFLIAYWLYIDGVDTTILMAVDYGLSLGFDSNALIVALLITQFVGFPSAIAFGKIGEKLGTKKAIFVGLGVYVLVAAWGFFMRAQKEFFILAVAIGLVQGGVQALSRSFYGRLIPAESAGEFFGFYNMLGKFAAIIGPFLMGWVSVATGSARYSILAVVLLFVSGGVVLYFVPGAGQEGSDSNAGSVRQ